MICTVVGARPNYIKMAPVILEARRRGVPQLFVHTGQHYDEKMSKVFFDDLGMPIPDVYLGVGSGSHAAQTAKVLTLFEQACIERRPKLVVVAGDVNSTLACALVAAKLHIPVAHVESGLRSNDRTMPEEINRIVTDHIADLLFTTEPSGNEQLRREGISSEKVHYVGNSMIDTLVTHKERALAREPWKALGLSGGQYGVLTLHRPSNVDEARTAREIAEGLRATQMPLVFPIHPRTLSTTGDIWKSVRQLRIVEPLGYLEFLGLMAKAKLVITDSGGIQEETTALSVPCLTIRRNTERPVTLTEGTNRLVDPTACDIQAALAIGPKQNTRVPDLWDGRAGVRILDVIERFIG